MTTEAEQQIRELYRKQLAGEISEAECMEQSLPFAQMLADQPRPSFFEQTLDYIKANPKVIHSITVGICRGIRHYIKS